MIVLDYKWRKKNLLNGKLGPLLNPFFIKPIRELFSNKIEKYSGVSNNLLLEICFFDNAIGYFKNKVIWKMIKKWRHFANFVWSYVNVVSQLIKVGFTPTVYWTYRVVSEARTCRKLFLIGRYISPMVIIY